MPDQARSTCICQDPQALDILRRGIQPLPCNGLRAGEVVVTLPGSYDRSLEVAFHLGMCSGGLSLEVACSVSQLSNHPLQKMVDVAPCDEARHAVCMPST